MASTTNKSARGGGNSIHLHHQPSSPPTISCSSSASNNSINSDTQTPIQTTSATSITGTSIAAAELPKTFIVAMRTLFDIMADESTGYVRFTDIEQRWREGSAGLPRGVIDSLRKFF